MRSCEVNSSLRRDRRGDQVADDYSSLAKISVIELGNPNEGVQIQALNEAI